MSGHGLSPEQLHGTLVRIVSREHPNFVGEARDRCEHGWLDVYLDALDPEDERVIGPLGADEVEPYVAGA